MRDIRVNGMWGTARRASTTGEKYCTGERKKSERIVSRLALGNTEEHNGN